MMRQVFGGIALAAGAFLLCLSMFANKEILREMQRQEDEARRYGLGGPPHPTSNPRLNKLIAGLGLAFIGLWLLGLLNRFF